MARKKQTDGVLADLLKMAEDYSVSENAMFIAAANQYALQQKVLDGIRKTLEAGDGLMVTKEYVKSRENVYANPLVKELPKHADSANKTAQTMLDIIKTLGHEKVQKSKLAAMMDE